LTLRIVGAEKVLPGARRKRPEQEPESWEPEGSSDSDDAVSLASQAETGVGYEEEAAEAELSDAAESAGAEEVEADGQERAAQGAFVVW
jgi:hypothetical protein